MQFGPEIFSRLSMLPSPAIKVTMTKIETERFTLRPIVRGDASAFYTTLTDEKQCLYLSRGAFADEEELTSWLLYPDWNERS